ncbi:MAG TPA: cupin domain-containing protein, partial [Longimicrobiales bacterium]|nr:cupin domain-containing protein [Longimicrobiales bacterium]
FRIEAGTGIARLDGVESALGDGSIVLIPAGVEHNIVNTSKDQPLRLYSLYSPPAHADGTVHHTKQDAALAEHH